MICSNMRVMLTLINSPSLLQPGLTCFQRRVPPTASGYLSRAVAELLHRSLEMSLLFYGTPGSQRSVRP